MNEDNLLEEGDIIKLTREDSVYFNGLEAYLNRAEYAHLRGKYIVVTAEKTPDRMGSYGPADRYYGGHEVTCQKVMSQTNQRVEVNQSIEVSFYQSGSFTIVNQNIKPIKKAKKVWEIIPDV